MKLTQFQVDAFADKAFSGNPAAVIVLDQTLDQNLMQSIASENNLSETSFVVRTNESDTFDIRWFFGHPTATC